MTKATGGGGARAALRRRPFRVLLAATAVSGLGDYVYSIALVALVFERTGSPAWIGALAAARVLPVALFGAVGGALSARFDRRRVLVGSDLVQFALMLGLAGVAATSAPAVAALVLAFALNTAMTPARSALGALLPSLVEEDELAAANGITATVEQVSLFAGPALGAVLFVATSAEVSFLVNAATFLASATLVARLPPAPKDLGPAGEPDDGGAGVVHELRAGWSVLRDTPGLLLVSSLVVAVMLAYGFEVVLHPLVADERLGTGPEGAGWLLGAVGIGGLLAAPFGGRIAGGRSSGRALAVAALLLGVPLMALAGISVPAVAYVVLLAEGVGNIVFEVVAITFVQRMVSGDDVARVLGIQDSAAAACMLLTTVLTPLLVELVGLEATLLLGGGVLVAFGLVAGPRLTALGRSLAASTEGLAAKVEVLGRLGLLEGAPLGSVERLAAVLTEEEVPAGTAVIVEGDEPDDLFVVRAGHFEARTEGELVNEFGSDDWFGEIGLLRSVPRTATVTATEPSRVWRLPGAAFLEAVAAAPTLPDPLGRSLAARLAVHESRPRRSEVAA